MTTETTTVPATCAALQELQRQRSVAMKSRNMQSNRLRAVVACAMGYDARDEETRKKKHAEAQLHIDAVREGGEGLMADLIRTSLIGIDAFAQLVKQLEKRMIAQAKALPAAAWVALPEQKCFGLLSLATVVGECGDLSNYANPAKVWRRMGCAPWSHGGKTLMGGTWRGGMQGKLPALEWDAYRYCPRRRSVAYLIGENVVKLNGTGPYRVRYDESKKAIKEKNPDYSDLRCHRHGMLLATKLLLKNLWCAWRDLRLEVAR